MLSRIVLPIIVTFVLPKSHLFPVEDLETNNIYSGTSLIDTENYDHQGINITTDSTDGKATIRAGGSRIMTKASLERKRRNQNNTVILRTLAYDGPLIVEKIENVKIAEKIPIFFRLVINDNAKEDPLIINSSNQLEDQTTTIKSNLNVF